MNLENNRIYCLSEGRVVVVVVVVVYVLGRLM